MDHSAAQERYRVERMLPKTAACDYCRSEPGAFCRSKKTPQYTVPFHQVRLDAVAGIPYAEAHERVAALDAEMQARRDAAHAGTAR